MSIPRPALRTGARPNSKNLLVGFSCPRCGERSVIHERAVSDTRLDDAGRQVGNVWCTKCRPLVRKVRE